MTAQISEATASAPRWVTFFGPIAKFLLAARVPLGFNGLITIRGRTSGQPRTTPDRDHRRLGQALGLVPVG